MPVMLETPRAFIKPIKTGTATPDPEIARCILINAIDVSAFTKRFLVVVGYVARLRIQSVQSARKQAYPKNAIGVLMYRLDPAG